MAKFLFAWELGGGLGHTLPLSQIARPLLFEGHEVHVALRDLSTAPAAFGAAIDHPGLHLWQAPVWLAALRGLPESATYAELLFRAGFLDPQRLRGLVRGWRSLFRAIKPQVLLVDHAPTALLAARGQAMRTASIGTGFFLPPRTHPMPPFREWETIDPARVRAAEEKALATSNAVLAELREAPLTRLHELVAVDEPFLLTWPELDHYGARTAEARYWGPLSSPAQGVDAVWADGDLPCVFAYLKGEYAAIEAVLGVLAEAPFRTLAYVSSLAPTMVARYGSKRLRLSPAPVNMAQVCEQAEVVICNAGSGTVTTVLHAGVPVVMLPMHAEQLLFSRRVEATGAGILLTETDARKSLRIALRRILVEPGYRQRARAFAAAHAADAGEDVAAAVAARCVALAAQTTG